MIHVGADLHLRLCYMTALGVTKPGWPIATPRLDGNKCACVFHSDNIVPLEKIRCMRFCISTASAPSTATCSANRDGLGCAKCNCRPQRVQR